MHYGSTRIEKEESLAEKKQRIRKDLDDIWNGIQYKRKIKIPISCRQWIEQIQGEYNDRDEYTDYLAGFRQLVSDFIRAAREIIITNEGRQVKKTRKNRYDSSFKRQVHLVAFVIRNSGHLSIIELVERKLNAIHGISKWKDIANRWDEAHPQDPPCSYTTLKVQYNRLRKDHDVVRAALILLEDQLFELAVGNIESQEDAPFEGIKEAKELFEILPTKHYKPIYLRYPR